MTKIVNPVPLWNDVYQPENGEAANAEDMLASTWQPLSNRDEYLKDYLDEEAAKIEALRQVFRAKIVTATPANTGTVFQLVTDYNPDSWYNIQAYGGGSKVVLPGDLSTSAYLVSVSFPFGADIAGGGAALIGVRVLLKNEAGTVFTSMAFASDAEENQGYLHMGASVIVHSTNNIVLEADFVLNDGTPTGLKVEADEAFVSIQRLR